jgi:hypothetical protein
MMNQIEKAMKEAHRFADKAIKDANKSDRMGKIKEWLMTDIVVKRMYLAVIYFSLFGFIALEILIY